ncbi:MAG: hypothetical protein OEY51_02720 [Cyclobacteriaceae bacterium]|nr:hypothetical protein [Cyclobacteriaceae bacterium]
MIDNYIKLIKKQVAKLDADTCDFEAWKSSSIVIFTRVFGKNDPKLSQLEAINVEYGSSWSMRTVSGSFDPVTSAKNMGRELMEIAIDELELFGEEITLPCRQKVYEALGEVMKVNDFNALRAVVESEEDRPVRKKKITETLKKYKQEEIKEVLVAILLNN